MSRYKLYSDFELVDLLRADDHVAFTEIYSRYSSVVYQNTYKLLRNRAEVMDIVQEIFTGLWNRRAEMVINSNLSGYLYIAARNSVFKALAHQQVEFKYVHLFDAPTNVTRSSSDYLIREKQLQIIIDQEIAGLPSKMREVLILSRKSFLSHKEIGQTLHISESTVKKQVNNALKILRVKLSMYLPLFVVVLSNISKR